MKPPKTGSALPISAPEAKTLFADWKAARALVLAVSGGPDSMALMWLAARWRRAMTGGPDLIAVTIDHGLRRGSAREARHVKLLATSLGVTHRIVRWSGAKPVSGLPAAARDARYRLLARTARAHGALHILTAHTRDDHQLARSGQRLRDLTEARLLAGVRLHRHVVPLGVQEVIAEVRRLDFGAVVERALAALY